MSANGNITKIEKGTDNGHRYQIVKFAHGAQTIACWGDDWGMSADGSDRWSVACTTHGYVMEFATYSRAKKESLQPGEWCTCCAEEIKAQAETVEAEEPAQGETVEAHVVVTNDEGRAFSVVVVLEGERYGLNDCLTHDKADPLVEFYDMTGDDRAFTGGRYYLSTLAGEDQWFRQPGEGLDLNGGVRDWSVSWENVCEAVAYARKRKAHA